MREIWIPIALIVLFLIFPVIRPFIRKFDSVHGIDWLPVPAFFVSLALIPAYGFRPEAFPLLLAAAALSWGKIVPVTGGRRFRERHEVRFTATFLLIIFLAAAAVFAFAFSPRADTALTTEGVYTLPERGRHIRVYTETESGGKTPHRPLLLLLPPSLHSFPLSDQVSSELRNRGFTVVSGARQGASPAKWFRAINAHFSGAVSAKANAHGRRLEEARQEDVRFLLSWIGRNPWLDKNTRLFDFADPGAVFVAGYGAAGSALVLLQPELQEVSGEIDIRGFTAIESLLWSLYREAPPQMPELPPSAGRFTWVLHNLNVRIAQSKPKRIAGLEPLPPLSAPFLFIVSDRSREDKHQTRYHALLETFRAARGPAALAQADGFGPFDFSDTPLRYPLVSALFPGRTKPARPKRGAPAETAAVIANFAAEIIKTQGQSSPLETQPSPPAFRVESRNR